MFFKFLVEGFGGVLVLEQKRPDGRIANAQVKIGNSTVVVSEASKQYPAMPAAYYSQRLVAAAYA